MERLLGQVLLAFGLQVDGRDNETAVQFWIVDGQVRFGVGEHIMPASAWALVGLLGAGSGLPDPSVADAVRYGLPYLAVWVAGIGLLWRARDTSTWVAVAILALLATLIPVSYGHFWVFCLGIPLTHIGHRLGVSLARRAIAPAFLQLSAATALLTASQFLQRGGVAAVGHPVFGFLGRYRLILIGGAGLMVAAAWVRHEHEQALQRASVSVRNTFIDAISTTAATIHAQCSTEDRIRVMDSLEELSHRVRADHETLMAGTVPRSARTSPAWVPKIVVVALASMVVFGLPVEVSGAGAPSPAVIGYTLVLLAAVIAMVSVCTGPSAAAGLLGLATLNAAALHWLSIDQWSLMMGGTALATFGAAVILGPHAGRMVADRGQMRWLWAALGLITVPMIVRSTVPGLGFEWAAMSVADVLAAPLALVLFSAFEALPAVALVVTALHTLGAIRRADRLRAAGKGLHNRSLADLDWLLQEFEDEVDDGEVADDWSDRLRDVAAKAVSDPSWRIDTDPPVFEVLLRNDLRFHAGGLLGGVRLHVSIADDFAVEPATARDLATVVTALVINAAAAGAANVGILARSTTEEKWICVVDDGPGWAGPAADGTGSMSTWVPTLIATMNAAMTVHPRDSGGTEVVLQLPVHSQSQDERRGLTPDPRAPS